MAAFLVVDDDESQAHTLALSLRLEGLDATAAVGPQAALAMLRVAPARVVVCDLRMKGKSGLELARELEAVHPGTKVVLTSGYPLSDAQLERSGCQAIVGFVPKPCDLPALVTLLRRLYSEPPAPPPSSARMLTRPASRE